jgi:ATP-dependent helicase/nuclease subunit A
MSIHKCKGLEFPVVFIYGCAQAGKARALTGLAGFHEKYGIILNIPQADELPVGGNYFEDVFLKEEKEKDAAELKRLLYVAMTRAESRLFLTFTLPAQTQVEKADWDLSAHEFTSETILQRLVQFGEKTETKETFLTLLAGVLPDCPSSLCSMEVIPDLTRNEISDLANGTNSGRQNSAGKSLSQREAALAAAGFYESAVLLPEGKAEPFSLNASFLSDRFIPAHDFSNKDAKIQKMIPDNESKGLPLDVLEFPELAPADLGTLIHAVLEARLSGRPCFIPPKIISGFVEKDLEKILSAAGEMADRFMASDLGKRWSEACFRESEYPFISAVRIKEKVITVTGQIDLLFEEDLNVVVLDFKTDKAEAPEKHYGQLAVYYRAAGDIFCKPVSVWLFYLRSGRAVNVTEEVKLVPLEELALAALDYAVSEKSG